MTLSTNQPDDNPTPPDITPIMTILKDLGNVTWRMATPILLGIAFGMMLDNHFDRSPWGLTIGMFAGILLTVVLIKNLYKNL